MFMSCQHCSTSSMVWQWCFNTSSHKTKCWRADISSPFCSRYCSFNIFHLHTDPDQNLADCVAWWGCNKRYWGCRQDAFCCSSFVWMGSDFFTFGWHSCNLQSPWSLVKRRGETEVLLVPYDPHFSWHAISSCLTSANSLSWHLSYSGEGSRAVKEWMPSTLETAEWVYPENGVCLA